MEEVSVGGGWWPPGGRPSNSAWTGTLPTQPKAQSPSYCRLGVEVLVLPTKAPDLDPLDYGVFNNVKHAWQRVVQRDRPGWEEQKSLLVRLLKEFNADAAIKQLPSRIQKCIDAKGCWFEK